MEKQQKENINKIIFMFLMIYISFQNHIVMHKQLCSKMMHTEGSKGFPTVAIADTCQLLNTSTNCLYIPW